MTDVVTLQLPREPEFYGVAHLVLGGLAARLDLTYDVLEDMTTAIDELLRRREATGEVTLAIEIDDDALVARVGPFAGRIVNELSAPDKGLGLSRVLEATVDGVELTERSGVQWVELKKSLERTT